MKRRTLVAPMFAAIALSAPFAAQATIAQFVQPADDGNDGGGAWSVKCNNYAIPDAPIDPIVQHGQGRVTHWHTFFGSQGVNTNTTAAQLTARPNLYTNNCVAVPQPPQVPAAPVDNASYWAPLLMNGTCTPGVGGAEQSCPTGQRVTPAFSMNYYQQALIQDPNTIIQVPAGLEMMAGLPMNTGTLADSHIDFACIGFSKSYDPMYRHIPYPTATDGPNLCPVWLDGTNNNAVETTYLRMRVRFPNCLLSTWNGPPSTDINQNWNNGTTGGLPNMKYSDGATTCGTGYTPIPLVRVGVRWKINGVFDDTVDCADGDDGHGLGGDHWTHCYNLTNANLSSDAQAMAGMTTGSHGATAHADFMNGWSAPDLTTLMDYCYWTDGREPVGDRVPPYTNPNNCGAL